MVARAIDGLGALGGDLLDVGCGRGLLWPNVRGRFASYTGVDIIPFEAFPAEGRFVAADLDAGTIPLADASFDVVAAVETIEHLDGPRRFVKELARLIRPGGWLIITTPNQLSAHSLLSLLLRGYFGAFAEAPGLYPAHVTALVEVDLLRIARAGPGRSPHPLQQQRPDHPDALALAPAAARPAVQRQSPAGRGGPGVTTTPSTTRRPPGPPTRGTSRRPNNHLLN